MALEEALKEKAEEEPRNGLFDTLSENAEDEAEEEVYMDMMTALASLSSASAYQEQIGKKSLPHYMQPTKCASAKAVKSARPTRRVRPVGPVKPFAVADKTTAATRRYVEERTLVWGPRDRRGFPWRRRTRRHTSCARRAVAARCTSKCRVSC
ncbi:hypothetical protein AV274_2619 [Blastocystis sp. ATCC 50177/Nand II]|uniref:Uncharacterized protein n=1 Tax=Blastocystis sp. subtype 1 (strain ATCC 50177 / NandII) TaxID=478820 RepID=A0A196SF81_BLAHN|nr:hypothetical protein AV274_2619 [Blastocystis sp. ATCC 50177/Nand II]